MDLLPGRSPVRETDGERPVLTTTRQGCSCAENRRHLVRFPMASNGPDSRKKIHPIQKVTSGCKARGYPVFRFCFPF